MKKLQKIISWPFLAMIKFYQKTLSFDHGPLKTLYPHGFCQFQPSCSQYTYEAIDKHGVIKGTILGSWRVLRCNPWAKGGKDAVPDKFTLPRFEGRK
jgi:putative membrane protein insertion efficiency factor